MPVRSSPRQNPSRSTASQLLAGGWIDVTVPVSASVPVWPGDPLFQIQRFCKLAQGDDANVSSLAMSAHTGTHVDAPVHYIEGAYGADAIPLDCLIGRTQVVPITQLQRSLEGLDERVLVRTRMSKRRWWCEPFTEDFPALSPLQARKLVAAGVRTVGIDYLSIGDAEVHRILLGAGVCVIEGLDLTHVRPGSYEMICLPLRLVDADGAPARVLLRAC